MSESKKNRVITIVLLLVCTIGLVLWDGFVAFNETRNDTISEILRDVSHSFWILPFMVMGVMGHLFWNKRTERDRVFRPGVLIGSCAVVVLRDLINVVVELPTFHSANIVIGLIGLVVGAKFWPQGPKWDGVEGSNVLLDSEEKE